MHIEPPTYSELLEQQQQKVAQGELNCQTAANRATALRRFLEANRTPIADIIGPEMRADFPAAFERLADQLRQEGKSDRAISNTKAALTPWKSKVAAADILMAQALDEPTPFQAEFKRVMAGHAVKTVARQAGVTADTLFGWLKGKVPRVKNAKYIRRIETFFSLERDSLVKLAGISDGVRATTQVGVAPVNEYRETLGQRAGHVYFLGVPQGSPLRAQWEALLRYKTAMVPPLLRSAGGRWGFATVHVIQETPALWYQFLNGVEVPAARSSWAQVASLLGWMALGPQYGGLGFAECQLQTMAWLVVQDYIEAFLKWKKARSNGKHSQGLSAFFGMLAWMLRPGDGYLYQRPELAQTLPEQFRTGTWEQMCSRQYDYCELLMQALRQEIRVVRDPFIPLQPILDLPEPMEAIADMVQRMRMDRPVGCTKKEALWARDICMVKLFVSNPLRLRNMAALTWNEKNIDGYAPPDVGSLYKRGDGSWWLFVPKQLLKNRRGGAAIRDYDSPVHPTVWADLERYLFKHRPHLMRWSTDLVFLARTQDPDRLTKYGKAPVKPLPREHRPFMNMSRHVFELTRKYLWKSNGIGTHSSRHLAATSILKAPGGDFKTAALVLNDRQATVEKHYAWLNSGDGATRMGELLDKSLRRM